MGKSRRSSVQRYHDRVAGRYDDSYNDSYWKWHDSLTWDYLKPFLPSDLRTPIVDLGCGTGKWTVKIAKSGFQVTGIDISPKMLNQTLRKLADAGANDRADTLQANLCDLSKIPGQTFGMAVALGDPIGCTEDPRNALREIRRILTRDGVLVATFDNRCPAAHSPAVTSFSMPRVSANTSRIASTAQHSDGRRPVAYPGGNTRKNGACT